MVQSPEEEAARRIMSAALGVDVELHDDNSERGMHDFTVHYARDEVGAAEMTTISDQIAQKFDAEQLKTFVLSNSAWGWQVHAPPTTRFKTLLEHLECLAAASEAICVDDVDALVRRWRSLATRSGTTPDLDDFLLCAACARVLDTKIGSIGPLLFSNVGPLAVTRSDLRHHLPRLDEGIALVESCDRRRLTAALDYFSSRRFLIFTRPRAAQPGKVTVLQAFEGAMTHETVDPFLDWLDGEFRNGRFGDKISKLERSGCDDRHLFLRLHSSGVGLEYRWAVEMTDTVPNRDPWVECRGLTGLWIAPDRGRSVLYWTAASGWARLPWPPSRHVAHVADGYADSS